MFKSGKWKFAGIPEFASESDADRYFDKESNYWVKGRYGLTGDFYKYLTMYKIRNRVSGEEFFPDYRMVDCERIFPWIQDVLKNKQDGMFVTQRGGGKSTVFLGYLPLETAIQNPGAKVIMTSESVSTTATNFSEKLKVAYEGLHPYYRPSLVAEWPDEKAAKQYIRFGKRTRGKDDQGSKSIIQSIETAKDEKSPSKLEGQGCIMLLVDELYKHPFTNEVRSRGGPLLLEGKKKVGSMISVGSLSDPTAKGLQNAIDMVENASTIGLNVLFVPASWFNPYIEMYDDHGRLIPNQYHDVTKNGNPQFIDVKKAEAVLRKNRSILERLPNKKLYYEEIMKYPLELDELLKVTQDAWWTEYEQEEINRQAGVVKVAFSNKDFSRCDRPAYVIKDKESETFKLEYQGVSDDTAKFFVFEEPVLGRSYGVGIDTIPFNSENKEGSDHVALVKCFDTDQYVAGYYDRTYDAGVVARNTAILQIIYNKAPALVEKNSIGALKTVYEFMGLLDLLAFAPVKFRAKAATIERGLNKDKNAATLHQLVRNYLFGEPGSLSTDRGLELMYMRRFFKEYIKFPFENADFLDAMAMAEALHTEHRRILLHKKMYGSNNQAGQTVQYRTINGVRQMVVSSNNHVSKQTGELDLSGLFKSK